MSYSDQQRLIVVSNRLPIALKWMDDHWEVNPGSGGLVTALAPVLGKRGGIWVGWPGTDVEADVSAPLDRFSREQGYDLVPVPLSASDVQGYYEGFSNAVLWPLFHDFHTHCNFQPDFWRTYETVNSRFAERIQSVARDDDYIWVHDYHLMSVARKLRESGGKRQCGFFLHIPFPAPDTFMKLPWRRELVRDLLSFDLVGMQTQRDVSNFVHVMRSLCSDVETEGGRNFQRVSCGPLSTKVGAFPISIDFNAFEKQASSREVSQRTASLNRLHANRQILLGIDRLDYTKGIPARLEALRQALLHYPDLQGKISLVQVVVPSREHVPEYKKLKVEIERLVGEINGQFTTPGWIPIHYLYRSLPREELISFYRFADMALVTPLRDGMNLVAKEYCACNYREDGVLILSEFAGTAAQFFEHAILVNPYDVEGMARAIRQGYYMPREERRHRMRALRNQVAGADIHWWVDSFLHATEQDPKSGGPLSVQSLHYLASEEVF
ncbi:alpha,alpha-trehalose-phosphate synthase (UDP-forming) [Desulfohalobium retbaense]|uniref:Alpha,alpha-trehalose-phosphate synthase (UDP-forming) n=1 Tax=Desulfohalobium retbaense (strain ATCC 49708 / DSM 5692 / JCM 16813 / HR100) TaxID=485915 RepID=C8X4G3_DESRD|nr:trehalose-6-phosphate synthase [Desulfohalobium retbaense]ACV69186.1 Alpha,alpha-trehalose-phosphate synthase (UDP- forming) [Desulfohalobium retbaense DSM 5692]